ncbi:MAG: NAD-dependent epimerase/dehydratase family protein [Desulfobacterales bacterium]|nr:NAD-dependent epimerase/dehydratase family protein [Desulfobacterales bacterium]
MAASKKWLITGGCGFIGASLTEKLVTEGGHFIRILDNLSVGSLSDIARVCGFTETDTRPCSRHLTLSPYAELIVGDIRDYDTCCKASEGVDIIVHLAANTGVGPSVENPKADMESNIIGIFNMLEAAKQNRVSRFIFASSGAPVGECEPPIHEGLAPHPVSPYGASKLAGEGYCSAYFHSFGIETVALRFGNVYGPGSGHKNSVVAKFIRQAMNGETLEIYGDGNQTRDFIFIDDLIMAIMLSSDKSGIGGEIFQIAANTETTVKELAEKLLPILSDSGYKNVQVRYTAPRTGDVRRNFSDTSKAGKMLGWNAETGFTEGLRRTMDWFVNFNL